MELVPRAEPQPVNASILWECRPEKFELWNGVVCGGGDGEIEKLLLMLMYNMGLKRVLELLPDESKDDLRRLLSNPDN
jgi:hypothetical protein